MGGADTKVELHSYLPSNTKVGFLNWGRHHGTNLYNKTKNIIVIGNYGYPKQAYTALEIAASGIGIEEMESFRWEEMRESEIAHNMLQGMLRGNARNSDNGIARECDIYLIASANPDMKRILANVFPNAVFDEWGVNRKDGLTGQSGKVLDHLKALFADSSTDKVRKKAVREAVGIADAQGLTNVLARDEVRSALEEAGIAVKLQHFERSSG